MKKLRVLLYITADILSCAATVVIMWALRSNFETGGICTLQNLACYFGAAAFLTVIAGFVFKTYYSQWRHIGFSEVIRIILSVCAVTFALLVLQLSSLHGGAAPFFRIFTKSVTASFAAFMFLFEVGIRCIPRAFTYLTSRMLRGEEKRTRAVIIGAGYSGAAIAGRLSEDKEEKIEPVAFIDDDPQKKGLLICGVKVYGEVSELNEIVKKCDAQMIIISLRNLSDGDMNRLVASCAETGLPIKVYRGVGDMSDKAKLKEVSVEDLLFRDMVKPDMDDVESFVAGKTILVTGGAGSIGSELCRQVLSFGCKKLYIFDIHENGLFDIDAELKKKYEGRYVLRLGSIRDKERIDRVLAEEHFDIVIHAAAHKHVPMMEINPVEAVKNNVFGTRNVIMSCTEHGVGKFVMISTDKAVHPKNIMGATKRACELMVKTYSGKGGCEMCAVRFGNVLGSNGSVIPTFRKQIAAGGPVTVTHKDITRFFMTIPEAVSLVLCAGRRARGGEIFVLNMEKPIRIYDLAVNMIRLSGKEPDKDIKIVFTGLRPGEKLYEELSFASEDVSATDHARIFTVNSKKHDYGDELGKYLPRLRAMIDDNCDEREIYSAVFSLIDENIDENGNDESKLHAAIAVG